MKNLIPEVAKLLGVEIGEEFRIKKYDNRKFKFYKDGLKIKWDGENDWDINSTWLMGLVTGEDEIIKLPWKPQKDAAFWYVGVDGGVYIVSILSDTLRFYLMQSGNCFRTRKEAEANADRIGKEIMGI